jgi:carboxypeptidase Q
VPTVIVMAEHYNMIVRMMQAGVVPQLRLELRTSYLTDDLNSYNVIAEIPGEDPVLRSEVVIVGAHLDSLPAGAGATDNADGVVAVVEAMRILKAVGARPRRTIRVAIWSGEEVGFVGGRAYVQ